MPSSLSERPRAGRVFLAAAFALVTVTVLSAAAVMAYAHATAQADHTLNVRRQVVNWLNALVDAESGARGYLASNDPTFLEPYVAALPVERTQAALVRELLAGDALAQTFEDADRDARESIEHLGELVALVRNGHRDEALARLSSGEGKRHMDAFRRDAEAIRSSEANILLATQARARRWARLALGASVVLMLLASLLLALAWRRERAHRERIITLATEARARLKTLSELAAALAQVRTRAEVASVIVEAGMRATGADTCTLYEVDDTSSVLELLADRGVAPEVLDRIRRITETEGTPGVLANMKAGRSVWAESEADYVQVYPDLATVPAVSPRAKAFWSVPLVAEGRPLGLLGVGYYEARRFTLDERTFIETLSRHCAEALLRATRLEHEDETRSWFGTTLRSIGDAVIATDTTGNVTFMNPVAETLTGWPEAEARGRPLAEVFCIVSQETRTLIENPVAKVLRAGKVVGLANHTLLRSRRGGEIPIDDSGAPILSENGKKTGVVLVFRDASGEARARVRREFLARAGEALVSSIDYEATLLTIARSAVPTLADWCTVDLVEPGGTAPRQVAVAHVNEDKVRLARELGERYPRDRDATMGVPQVIRTGRSELYPHIPRDLLEHGARDGQHAGIIRELQLESAMIVPLRVRGRTFGAITFVHAESRRHYTQDDLSFSEDFARRAAMAIENAMVLKEAEAARAREQVLRSEAELANRAKDEFLATVSHELRTPLTAILGWATLLRRRKAPPEIDRGLATIERNARLQTKLIEDVLDISRIISGKLALNIASAKLGEVIGAAVETVTPAANLKGITIATELPAEELTMTADADRLQQVIWNLLVNAVKFTPKGGRIDVRAGRDGSDVWFSIQDSGEGIRHEVLPVLFEPFRQADASTTRRHGGLGLGLAIVKQLVVAHGGSVSADSEGEGHGATFTVRLPTRATVPVLSTGVTATEGPASLGRRATDEVSRLDGLRVLIVDDEQDALDILGEVLGEQGAEVHEASSARQALRELAEVRPHVLVSDIGMPEMDGLALMQQIRALPAAQGGRTRAIALTAFARHEDVQRALEAGYQMHIAKPVEIPQLAKAIANFGREARGDA